MWERTKRLKKRGVAPVMRHAASAAAAPRCVSVRKRWAYRRAGKFKGYTRAVQFYTCITSFFDVRALEGSQTAPQIARTAPSTNWGARCFDFELWVAVVGANRVIQTRKGVQAFHPAPLLLCAPRIQHRRPRRRERFPPRRPRAHAHGDHVELKNCVVVLHEVSLMREYA